MTADSSTHKASELGFVATAQEQAMLLDLTHDAILVLERETSVILYWNRGAEELYGWTKEEALGQVSYVLLKTRFPEPFSVIETALCHAGRWEGELVHTCRDGRRVVVESRWSVQRDADGKPLAHLEINTDITHRKRTEVSLRMQVEVSRVLGETQLDYPQLLERVAKLIAEMSGDGCVIRLLSSDQRALVPVTMHHPDPALLGAMAKAALGSTEEQGIWEPVLRERRTVRFERSDNHIPSNVSPSQREFMINHNPRAALLVPLIARGALVGALGLVRFEAACPYTDAEESLAQTLAARVALAIDNARLYREAHEARHRADQTLALLDTLVTSAPVGIAFLDRELRYIRINQWLADLNGLPISAHLGRTVRDVLPELADQLEPILVAVLAASQPALDLELSDEKRSGHGNSHHFRMSFYPVRCEAGEVLGIGGIIEDITAAVRAKEERAQMFEAETQARAAAEAANRAKDEFLSILSHELRTPLTAILGWSHILRTKREDHDTLSRGLETIERNAKVQAQLIEDILDVSRIVTGKLRVELRPIELGAVVQAAIEVVRPAAESKAIALDVDLMAAPCTIEGDAERLQQVAWNLLSNAVKFTPQGGRIEVRVQQRGASVDLRVSDTGTGIAPEFLTRIFERFQQADTSATRAHGGLGLGLSIAKYLVEQHRGSIVASSHGLDRGATFTVTLPRLVAASPECCGDEPRARAARLDGVRVLVVDDEPDARDLAAMILHEQGAQVTLASSAREALTILEREAIDVLVSDIGMPGEDGYDLLYEATARGWYGPALALTAYASSDDAKKARRVGFRVHVPKPVTPERLVEVVSQLAAEAQPAQPTPLRSPRKEDYR